MSDNSLGTSLEKFFREYLPNLRGMSPHTLRSYRDSLILFLRHLSAQTGKSVDLLDLSDVTADHVISFLDALEKDRHNGIATRNSRLSALHTFVRFLTFDHPEKLAELQRVLGVPFKRGARSGPVEYLDQEEMAAFLTSIDRSSLMGRRDYALFSLMFNTGGRVQEILNLKRSDVRLQPPFQVRLHGKGGKTRFCPIWPQTARLLKEWTEETSRVDDESPLFSNRQGTPLTRFGVRYLLQKYAEVASEKVATLKEKRLHPHVFRHTTAMHLLKAGVDFSTISQWLGHASLNTTMKYAKADLEIKRRALSQINCCASSQTTQEDQGLFREEGVVDWLKRL